MTASITQVTKVHGISYKYFVIASSHMYDGMIPITNIFCILQSCEHWPNESNSIQKISHYHRLYAASDCNITSQLKHLAHLSYYYISKTNWISTNPKKPSNNNGIKIWYYKETWHTGSVWCCTIYINHSTETFSQAAIFSNQKRQHKKNFPLKIIF